MFIIQYRVAGLRTLVLLHRELVQVLLGWRVTCVVMMIAVGVRHRMMSAGLVILELVGMILPECRIEVLLLVCSGVIVSCCTCDTGTSNHILLAHEALNDNLLLLTMP
jgi:hypothetical protein